MPARSHPYLSAGWETGRSRGRRLLGGAPGGVEYPVLDAAGQTLFPPLRHHRTRDERDRLRQRRTRSVAARVRGGQVQRRTVLGRGERRPVDGPGRDKSVLALQEPLD